MRSMNGRSSRHRHQHRCVAIMRHGDSAKNRLFGDFDGNLCAIATVSIAPVLLHLIAAVDRKAPGCCTE